MNTHRSTRNLAGLTCLSLVSIAVLVFSSSCNSDGEGGYKGVSSSCGGFAAEAERSAQALMLQSDVVDSEVGADCSEVLQWSYDSGTGTATFVHRNNRLNCCGERSIEAVVSVDGAAIELAETDRSQNGTRCNCVCMYDFEVKVPDVEGVVAVEVTLWEEQEESNPGRQVVWAGEIDLGAGVGSELIRERSGECW